MTMSQEEKSIVKYDLTVLYVEDEEIIRERFSNILRRRIENVYEAKNGIDGLDLYHQIHPDIVITDIKMPVMNGLEMVREIRHVDSEVVIIITTALNDSDLIIQAIDIGVDKFLLKPIKKENLDDILYKFVKKISSEKELKKKVQYLETVLDLQENSIVVRDGEKSNGQFLEPTEADNPEEFKEIKRLVCNFLIKGDCVSNRNGGDVGLLSLLSKTGAESSYKVKMFDKQSNQDKIFKLSYHPIGEDSPEFVLSLKDITSEVEDANGEEEAIDSVTNLFSELKFSKYVEAEIKRIKFLKPVASVLVFSPRILADLDINNKKDEYDKVLRYTAKIVLDQVRKNDVLARWGGDKFILFLPGTAVAESAKVAEKLSYAVEDCLKREYENCVCNFGVTQLSFGEHFSDFVQRAEVAFYDAVRNKDITINVV